MTRQGVLFDRVNPELVPNAVAPVPSPRPNGEAPSDATTPATYTAALVALFLSHPYQEFDGLALAKVAGAYAWRTRVSNARLRLKAAGQGDIVNTLVRQADGSVRSLYVFVPRETAA